MPSYLKDWLFILDAAFMDVHTEFLIEHFVSKKLILKPNSILYSSSQFLFSPVLLFMSFKSKKKLN